MNPEVEAFLNKPTKWKKEIERLRRLLLECGLTESIKWRNLCYSINNSNIVIIQPFKVYCALGFFNGALLSDPDQLLIKPGANTQAGRQLRFTDLKEIEKKSNAIKRYLKNAMEIQKKGIELIIEKNAAPDLPDELTSIFKQNAPFKKAFHALTPGRQRAYLIFFTGSKNTETRQNRINKYIGRILDGKGINDCTCGLSKRMPQCDGSHRFMTS